MDQPATPLRFQEPDLAIYMLDPGGRVESWNAGAERIKGYRAEEILGRNFSLFYAPDDVAAGKPERDLQIAQAEGRYEEEGWRVRKDGSLFLASVVITALHGREGELRGFEKVTRDVTEKHRAREALQQSEERFRLMVEAVRDHAIFTLDPEGRISSWNRGAERIEGHEEAEVVGKPFSSLFLPEDQADGKPERHLRLATEEGSYEEEGWLVRKDGARFWANLAVTAVWSQEGQPIGFTVVTRDFSERQKAAERLRQSEQTFRLLVESVRDYAIYMLDPEGRISSWNAGAQHLKGYRAEDVLGRSFSIFYTEADRARAHPQEELEHAKRDGSYREEGWRVRKDGTLFWASVVITTIYDERRRLIGFAKVTRDMTERRAAEESLQRMNEDLQVRMRQQLAARLDVESFSYSVSHDLRAPLRALDGFSRLLLEGASERLTAGEKDYLQRIRGAAQQMSQLIDAMLGLSRLTSAAIDLQEVDVSAQCRAIAASLAQADPEREVRWSIADGIKVSADPRLLGVVLENLLRNAWKFTRKVSGAHIEVGIGEDQGERALHVRDNGVGFSMEQAHRLFVPFQRLHRAKDFEGTGIGLATVRRIIERHGGRVWVDSAPGQGTTFHFTLGKGDAT